MKLLLKNIGPVRKAEIDINGLTVITGENNSGKTTIGRALYSVVAATEDPEGNNFLEKQHYAYRKVYDAMDVFEFYRFFEYPIKTDFLDKFSPEILKKMDDLQSIIAHVNNIKEETSKLTAEIFIENVMPSNTSPKKYDRTKNSIIRNIETQKIKSTEILDSLLKVLNSDLSLERYTNERIIQTLHREFSGQIHPVKGNKSQELKIKLSDAVRPYYEIDIVANSLKKGNCELFSLSAFTSSIFIDDVRVIDKSTHASTWASRNRIRKSNNFYDSLSIQHHNDLLYDMLRDEGPGVLEGLLNKDIIKPIVEMIESVSPSRIIHDGINFVVEDTLLLARNMAMGAKIFAIILSLLEKGHIGPGTLLILDEPESNLHTEWQNVVAKLVILLVKELDVKIVLTTHSPTFLLALETFMLEQQIQDKCSFYQSVFLEDNYMVEFKDITKNLNDAYNQMTKPFVDMNTKRTNIITNMVGKLR